MMEEIIQEIKIHLTNETTLVAVSKTRSNEEILKAYNLGIRDFGENYVQELIEKMDKLPEDIKWHMIGHLQTNKVKDIVKRNIYLIESVDSIKLAKEINKEALKNNKKINILIEVNITDDPNKSGCKKEDLKTIINEVNKLSNVNLKGLMTLATKTNDVDIIKNDFKKMKQLKDEYNLSLLSMGMSNDYKIAISEGSNIIRIGTKIFGERKYN